MLPPSARGSAASPRGRSLKPPIFVTIRHALYGNMLTSVMTSGIIRSTSQSCGSLRVVDLRGDRPPTRNRPNLSARGTQSWIVIQAVDRESIVEPSAGVSSSSEAEEFRRRLRAFEQRMHPKYDLRFDGRRLTLRENDRTIADWAAVSGRPGRQDPQYQSLRDQGPLPQGEYRFRVSEMQRFEDLDAVDKVIGGIGLGPWRGGTNAWGRRRFWLTPSANSEMFGRDGFSIHGGKDPGSAGCIDLTDEMDEFAELMSALGQDEVAVKVEYGSDGSPNHRRRRGEPVR